jgi:hypothetical protein
MRSRKIDAKIAVIALAAAASLSPALAQQGKPQLFAYHSEPVTGGCPGLDWHIMREPDGKLSGFVAWDRMQHMAHLAGSINKNRNFVLDAKEEGGAGRTAVVHGYAGGSYINAMITGSGTPCDDLWLNIPVSAGGTGGGGG